MQSALCGGGRSVEVHATPLCGGGRSVEVHAHAAAAAAPGVLPTPRATSGATQQPRDWRHARCGGCAAARFRLFDLNQKKKYRYMQMQRF